MNSKFGGFRISSRTSCIAEQHYRPSLQGIAQYFMLLVAEAIAHIETQKGFTKQARAQLALSYEKFLFWTKRLEFEERAGSFLRLVYKLEEVKSIFSRCETSWIQQYTGMIRNRVVERKHVLNPTAEERES